MGLTFVPGVYYRTSKKGLTLIGRDRAVLRDWYADRIIGAQSDFSSYGIKLVVSSPADILRTYDEALAAYNDPTKVTPDGKHLSAPPNKTLHRAALALDLDLDEMYGQIAISVKNDRVVVNGKATSVQPLPRIEYTRQWFIERIFDGHYAERLTKAKHKKDEPWHFQPTDWKAYFPTVEDAVTATDADLKVYRA